MLVSPRETAFRDHCGVLSVTTMGMSLAIAEVNCAAQFAVANINIASASLLPKCPNCGGRHSANDKICPRYKRETEILKLKTEAKMSYADACKAQNCQKSPRSEYGFAIRFSTSSEKDRSRSYTSKKEDLLLAPLHFRMQLVSHRITTRSSLLNNLIFPAPCLDIPVTFLAF